jgi:hypothetical protein
MRYLFFCIAVLSFIFNIEIYFSIGEKYYISKGVFLWQTKQ